MKTATRPEEIRKEYEACVSYNRGIGLYDTVRQNEQFYIGRQWEGLNAPDLDKPVLNFLKRVGSYIVAMLVSDDIAVEVSPFDPSPEKERAARLLSAEIERVIENTKAKSLMRDMLRNCVVDGDGCFYWYYDCAAEGPQSVRGDICLELIDNTRVLFGNPFIQEVQKQPYILIVKREQLETVRERARRFSGAKAQDIRPDNDALYAGESAYSPSDLVTVIVKLYRREGGVWFTEVTRDAVVRPATDTGYRRYPLSYMSYEKIKNSYHGQAIVTGLIPNQIAVNKLWAMAIHHQNTMAFPKVFYDRLKIKSWSNRVGEAIGVAGNPSEAVTTAFKAPDMSAQLIEVVNRTIEYTKEFMGASDAALGNVRPDNTSAIIAVQKATAAPLDLQRLALYQFVEDYVRIIADMICATYGPRRVRFTDENGEPSFESFDFSKLDLQSMQLKVEVGASAYWSELTQLGTLDSLFAKGIIDDALVYLESVPDSYIRNKGRILQRLRERKDELKIPALKGKTQAKSFSEILNEGKEKANALQTL
ncbi:MAG: hypothetical protein Q4B42_04930 [Oscillospiraceae bacterium]|nr:hypothetical protein [Oscillospiraceae bacterium]